MPTLDWIGKKAVVNHHREVPYRILKEDSDLSYGKKDSGNLIVEGDNLEALRALLPYYKGKVKCIYIDPPYNTGNEGWVYNDNVNSPEIKKWLGKVVGKEMEDLSRHDKWLCMMYPRLSLLKEFLSDDGAIFISIDDNELAHLKLICNEIFGNTNFVAQFNWKRKKEISSDSKNVSIQGEYILCYAKSDSTILKLEKVSDEYIGKSYKEANERFPLGKWRPVPLTVSKGLSGGGYTYTITNPNGTQHTRLWAYPEDSYSKLVKSGRVYFGKDGNGIPQRVMYANESKGQPTTNYWDNVSSNKEGKKAFIEILNSDSFYTPKPVKLIKKIVSLISDNDSLILDSFAGSGTTAQAVLELNKEDGGNRKFILCEMLPEVAEPITRERAKRVIERDGLQEQTGFKFVKLGEQMFTADGDINPEISYEDLARHVFFMATGTPLDSGIAEFKTPLIGVSNGAAIYLLYNGILKDTSVNGGNRLTQKVLKTLPKHDGVKIIYGTACGLSESVLRKNNIVFRQTPYTIFDR